MHQLNNDHHEDNGVISATWRINTFRLSRIGWGFEGRKRDFSARQE
jgi:hypothetical protein